MLTLLGEGGRWSERVESTLQVCLVMSLKGIRNKIIIIGLKEYEIRAIKGLRKNSCFLTSNILLRKGT